MLHIWMFGQPVEEIGQRRATCSAHGPDNVWKTHLVAPSGSTRTFGGLVELSGLLIKQCPFTRKPYYETSKYASTNAIAHMTQTTSSPLVSVIVPVYNVAQYVAACLHSLRDQTLSDFEVIVVIDGATDDSAAQARAAVTGDTRFRFIEQANQGLSGARNTGLGLARGVFIAFVDSDDRVMPNYLQSLYDALQDSGADWVACGVRFCGVDGSTNLHSAIHGAADLTRHRVPHRYGFDTWCDVIRHFPSAWNKLYRRDLIGDLRFDESTWFEDHGFYQRLAARTDHLLHIPDALYLQTQGRDGQITRQDDDRVFEQFAVLDAMRGTFSNDHPDGDRAFAQIATRLIYERSTALRDPSRRGRFARASAEFLARHGISYAPEDNDDPEITHSWALEMDGLLPLSIVIAWDGKNAGALATSLTALSQSHGPAFEVIVVCSSAKAVSVAHSTVPNGLVVTCQHSPWSSLGDALDFGLRHASGRFVTFLSVGDVPHPWAYLRWVDLLLTSGAQMGISHYALAGVAHHAVQTPFGIPPLLSADGTFTASPRTALDLDVKLSAAIFDRAALTASDLMSDTGGRPEVSLCLSAALLMGNVACSGWNGVDVPATDGSEAASLNRPSPVRLWRDHNASVSKIKASLPPHLLNELPHGWERRLFARQFGQRLHIGAASRVSKVWLSGGAALGAAALGYGATSLNAAPLDPSVGPKQALVLNMRHILFMIFQRLRGRRAALPDLSKASLYADGHYAFPADGAAVFRFRANFHYDDYANLSFHTPEILVMPFHVSLRHKEQRIVWNDTAINGAWRRERSVPFPLSAAGEDVLVVLSPKRVTLSIDDKLVFDIAPATLWNRLGTRRIADISSFTRQGGVHPIELLPQPPLTGDLILDSRLQLLAKTPNDATQWSVNVSTTDGPAEHFTTLKVATGAAVRVVLPGRIWKGVAADDPLKVTLLRDAKETSVTLSVSRQDVAARIDALLAGPMSYADAALIALAVEHVVHGNLLPLLTPDVQPKVMSMAKSLGQSVPTAGVVAPPAAPRTDHHTVQFQSALAQFTRSQNQSPPADPIKTLRYLSLDPVPRRILFLTLSETICQTEDRVGDFVDLARELSLPVFELGEETDLWTRSAMLPFLCLSQNYGHAVDVLQGLHKSRHGWVLTSPVAWSLRHVLHSNTISEQHRSQAIEAFIAFVWSHADDYWGRAPCQDLINSAAALLAHHHDGADRFCIEVYGLSPRFWTAVQVLVPEMSALSPELVTAFEHFQHLHTQPNSSQAQVRTALEFFIRHRTANAGQMARELGMPADEIVTECVNLQDSAAVRMAAFPNAPAQVDPERIVADIRHLSTVKKATDLDQRHRNGAIQNARWAETKTGADTGDFGPVAPHIDTLVVVFSCVANLHDRIPAMRSAWLSHLKTLGVPYIVVVGGGEGQRTGDIVHLDAPDDYESLPQKSLAAIAWVRDNTSFAHMFKIDDDCFLNAPLFFEALSYKKFDYYGRILWRSPGQMNRSWHQEKSRSDRGKYELDKSMEPSAYADGGSGYALSRVAMDAALAAADSPDGQFIIQATFMEDKMLGDLLALRGISVSEEDYHVSIRRRSHATAIPVPKWHNSFFPNKCAPIHLTHLDTQLDQAAAQARLPTTDLWPRKIWPGYQNVRLGAQTNALELVSSEQSVLNAQAADVAVVACMRNEMFMLPHFLAHYRKLGVGAFLIADNLSDDGTLEYLAEQPDVALFSVDTDYKMSHYGVAWQQAMLAAFRTDKWSVVADADEFLVWQADQTETLPELLSHPDFADVNAARIFMLDMYPQGALSEATFENSDPFTQAGFVDREPFLTDSPMRGPFSDQPAWTSALRHRLIPGSNPDLFVAQKLALLRYRPWMRLSEGLHFVTETTLSKRELLFAHFKYNAAFRQKAQAEVDRGQHFNDAEEYRKYLAIASEGRDIIYDADHSVEWHDSPFVQRLLT